jgi:aryl-phospho-beta-D-glucosidase BglC (GH1 family)
MKRILFLAPLFFMLSCGTDHTVAEKRANVPSFAIADKASNLPVPTAEKLPSSWKGFNLLNMFYMGGSDTDSRFNEEDFKIIAEWGFNFVRIPMDYRIWIKANNWNNINEAAIKRIDRAVEYGIKYDIHVCLNFHRAPGYTVASPPEKTVLWTQAGPQEAFARMWGYFAERYKNIPNEYLSFNLVNEPPDIDETVYAAVMGKAAAAIRAQDPGRLIIADGLAWGRKPSNMIKELGIAQASRGYEPFALTHYKAEWVEGSQDFPPPSWPAVLMPRYLYSPSKRDVPWSMYRIEHEFNGAYYLDVNVGVVSHEARLVVKADGGTIYDRLFRSAAGAGEWTTVVYQKEWNIYQNIFNKNYRIEIPAGTKLLTLELTEGDWMTVNDMKFTPAAGTGRAFSLTPTGADWGTVIPPVKINADGRIALESAYMHNREWLREHFKPWEDLVKSGGGAMIGEWGAHNKTSHDVVLAWMEDNLQVFNEAGMGWALWNLNGSFGVLNSGRAGVNYENFNRYKLDRKMLELLQKYPH